MQQRWGIRYRDKQRKHPIPCLEVINNGVTLEKILANYQAEHGLSSVGDVYVSAADLADGWATHWRESVNYSIYIMLMSCGCGHWECSQFGVRSWFQDDVIYWKYDTTPVHLAAYDRLPDYWFTAADYAFSAGRLSCLKYK